MGVIGIVGLPGSGKSEAATVAREAGVPVVTMGDVIRRECRDRDLDPATHHGEVASALREEGGLEAIAERSLPIIEDALDDADTVLVDGIRSDVEATRFETAFGEAFTLVAIEAPFEIRAERIDARGRDTPAAAGGESLEARDERERGFGMDDAIADADLRIANIHSLDTFHERIQALLDGRTDVIGAERGTES
ncbi:AAA family ATPase [Halococcus sp. PRR34]|nr:AAA family ATPase [Halococcus sp. PRR34]